jgi:hypothetical protein
VELAKETAIPDYLYQKMHQRYKQTDEVGMVSLIPITMADLKRRWLVEQQIGQLYL